jgi:hypothetical protein
LLFCERRRVIAARYRSGDQDLLTGNPAANARTTDSLINELKMLRLANKALFERFDERALLNMGTSWKYETSVLVMGFMMIGHQIHHLIVIEEKYFPLLHESQNG